MVRVARAHRRGGRAAVAVSVGVAVGVPIRRPGMANYSPPRLLLLGDCASLSARPESCGARLPCRSCLQRNRIPASDLVPSAARTRQVAARLATKPPGGYPNNAMIKRKLGSWLAACRAIGWRSEPRAISDDQQMLDALHAAAAELGPVFPHQRYKAISAAAAGRVPTRSPLASARGIQPARALACPSLVPSAATGILSSSPVRCARRRAGSDAHRWPRTGTAWHEDSGGLTAPR